jgi:oligoendopeptidase F
MSLAETSETLPRWDLSDLYASPEAPEIARDLKAMSDAALELEATYRGRIALLTGAELGAVVRRYEQIDETLSKLGSYAQLLHAADVVDPEIGKFYQSIVEKVTDITSHLLFLGLEINRIEEADFQQKLLAPELAHYKPWLEDARLFRDHQLSDEVEAVLHERHVVGAGAWNRLFDQTLATLRFDVNGEILPLSDTLNLMSDPDQTKRKVAAQALGRTLVENSQTFALITNTLAKDKQIDDRLRHYASPVSARNLSNQVEDEVVEALVTAVRAAYPRLSHRYYQLKAKWLGQDQLDYWDRNAPLPKEDDKPIAWNEAKTIVGEAYRAFSPRLAEIGQRFFDHNWIDVGPRPGKDSGAFAHPVVPSAHPYLLLNYHGKTRDVMTLAHELGHGCHQILAGSQGQLLSNTPLTLAETASVFGEMLTFQALLAKQTDPNQRRLMLAGKVEDMLNTVVRQIAFFTFEQRLHERRQDGELTPDEIGDIWMSIQGESLGPALRFDDNYRSFWAYIPHFIHSPFYVYAYAFGDCLVNALYMTYQESHAGFEERYLAMLSAGGSKRHKELLAPFGLDASDPAFWQKGLSLIEGFIDQIEALETAGK